MATKVVIKTSDVNSYATAVRAHLSAALAYNRLNDEELALIELNKIELCIRKIRSQVKEKGRA